MSTKTETPQRVGPLAPGSVAYALFEHMSQEHGLTLIGSELDEIIRVVNSALEERLRWWMRNAERADANAAEIGRLRAELVELREQLEWERGKGGSFCG